MPVPFAITNSVIKTLASLNLIGDILIVLLAAGLIYAFVTKKDLLPAITSRISQHAILLSFIVALIATAGSLFFSELAGFAPCRLCWFQRVLMYPFVVLFGIALFKKDTKIFTYTIPMAIIGALIAAWHYGVQRFHLLSGCDFDPTQEALCGTIYFLEFGYITIPILALTAFLLIALIGFYGKK